jgi:glucose uptake protein GlcU
VTLQKLKIDPIVMQLYNIFGVFITCWLLQCFLPFNEYIVTGAGNRFQFPLLGLVAGVLFVVSVCSAIVGYKKIGIALLSGISCGCTILSSWLWGVVAFDEQPERIAASITAIIVLIAAVFIISFSREIASSRMNASICQRVNCFGATSQPMTDDNVATSFSVALVTHAATSDTQSVNLNPHDSMLYSVSALPDNLAIPEFEPFTKDWYRNVIRGCIWACVCGFAGGTGWVPLQYMPTSQLGLVFLPVFSVGCLFTSVLVLLVYYSVVLKFKWPAFHMRESMFMGLLSGVLVTLCVIFTTASIAHLKYSLAYPLCQSSIVISGLWGIYAFDEIKGSAVYVFITGCAILLFGVIMLVYGSGTMG